MERPCHTQFDTSSRAELFANLTEKRARRISHKLASLYQDLTDISMRTLAVLSALNASGEEGLSRDLLAQCGKYGRCSLNSLKLTVNNDCSLTQEYFSNTPFKIMLKYLEAAELCLKIQCAQRDENIMISGDQLTRIKVRWHDLSREILKCMFELRSVGMEVQGQSPIKMGSTVEDWLIRVRSGESLLDDASGPFLEFNNSQKKSFAQTPQIGPGHALRVR